MFHLRKSYKMNTNVIRTAYCFEIKKLEFTYAQANVAKEPQNKTMNINSGLENFKRPANFRINVKDPEIILSTNNVIKIQTVQLTDGFIPIISIICKCNFMKVFAIYYNIIYEKSNYIQK